MTTVNYNLMVLKSVRCAYGHCHNALQTQLPTKEYLDRVTRCHNVYFFSLNVNSDSCPDCNASFGTIRCKNHSLSTFAQLISRNKSFESCLSLFHTNIRNLRKNLNNLQSHILYELNFHFNLLAVTEIKIKTRILT